MEPMPVQGIGQLFQRLERLADSGWAEVPHADATPGFRLLRLPAGSGRSLLRVHFEMDIPISEAAKILRPEVIFHPRRPEFDNMIAECGTEELIAPGDAHVWVKARISRAISATAALLSATIGTARALQQNQRGHSDDVAPTIGRVKYQRLRVTHRRDFPRPGAFSLAVAPRHQETGQLLEDSALSWVKATAMILEQHPEDETRTVVTQLKQITNVPNWALQLVASKVFLKELTRSVRVLWSGPMREAIVGAANYVIVSLRKCVKGNPLLPVWHCMDVSGAMCGAALEWVPAESTDGSKVSLPEYLLQFLARIGLSQIGVFGIVDGLPLVPYQAAVHEEAWALAWAALEGPFRMQRAAYRHTHGGSGAPVLTVGTEPRFMKCSEPERWLMEPKMDTHTNLMPEPVFIPVSGTFLDCSTACHRPRSSSEERAAQPMEPPWLYPEAMAC